MDWKSIISELQALGMSQLQIATACKCTQSVISDLANGRTKDPRDSIGQALRALLKKNRRKADTAQGV